MTAVTRLAPDPGELELEPLLAQLSAAPAAAPFSELAVDACEAIGRALLGDAGVRAHPDLVALASWLRRASTTAMARSLPAADIRVARGLAFHVAPANVDTIAMYSLALSILAGNRNIVRISARAGEGAQRICAALDEALALPRLAPIRAGTAVLRWDHDSDATALCSAVCDVRVLWGGDDTVRALRSLPLRPGARDVPFIDRFSFTAVQADAWVATDEDERDELTRRMFNDTYWFDQQGCSSPRMLVWCGTPQQAARASEDLFARLARQLRARGYELPLGAVMTKLAWISGAAIDRPLTRIRQWGNELSVLTLSTLQDLDRQHPGAGTFLEVAVPSLTDLAAHVSPRDQTLAVYGFERDELERFVHAAGGRGIDRIVPFGDALRFEHRWDGVDLIAELTRQVVISATAAKPAAALVPA
jgi:hypothetical protein